MAQFVSDGEGGAEPVILDDGAGRRRIAHGAQLGQTERVAFLHLRIAANVLSGRRGTARKKEKETESMSEKPKMPAAKARNKKKEKKKRKMCGG